MATSVGTESDFRELLKNLMLLEHDAIAAYEAGIDRLGDGEAQEKMRLFPGDHHRHMDQLGSLAASEGVEVPATGDMKRYLTTGKMAIAGMMGDAAILRATKSNEDDTVDAYERARAFAEASPEAREIFERAHQDELSHREWMEGTARK